MGILKEFKAFVARGNVIDLAVGIIMGTAFTGVVNSLVSDVILPPIGVIAGGMDFSDYFISLNGEGYATLTAAKDAGAPTLNYGAFINTVINFLIVSMAVFLLIKQVNRLSRAAQEAPAVPPAPTPSETLLTEIRDLLKQR